VYEIFSITYRTYLSPNAHLPYNNNVSTAMLHCDFSSLCLCPLCLRRSSHASVKEGYCLKVIILLLLLVGIARKQLQIGTDILLIVTSTSDELVSGVNIDDLKLFKSGFLVVFLQFASAAHILGLNCAEITKDRSGQP